MMMSKVAPNKRIKSDALTRAPYARRYMKSGDSL